MDNDVVLDRSHANSQFVRRSTHPPQAVSLSNSGPGPTATQLIDLSSIARRYRANGRGADEELRQLQSDLDTLERLFQTLLGQSFTAQLVRNIDAASTITIEGCPPASVAAIENLACIQVSREDLVDECNRECCICFFQHEVGDTGVARLPCGHLFHKPCIIEWLGKKCTCPICRYEIPTDNEVYEVERIERMKARKLRVKSHELSRLSIQALQQLTGTEETDRDALVEFVRNSENVVVLETSTREEEKEEITQPTSTTNEKWPITSTVASNDVA